MDALPEPLDVIAVGAHPDDVEIGCGGTLALLAAQGYRVGIVDLTDGEPTPRSSGPAQRLAEAAAAAKTLGVVHRETLAFPNRRLFDGFDVRLELATIFRRWRPKLVLGLADKTPLASPDHAQAVAITEAAVFYSRLTKWDEKFAGLPVHTVPQVLSSSCSPACPNCPTGNTRWWWISGASWNSSSRRSPATRASFPRRRPTSFRGCGRWLRRWD